ncbi:MAG: tetratricopeptide repeat protein, partial [Pseudomonadales bacterium]|nr:tetratricopeptide repeat protein [Pseudomonadales bacterium]
RFTEKDAINADLSDTDSETGQQWMDSGFWFAPVIAIFFVFFFRKGLLFLLPVLFFFQPQNALSLSCDELWLNKEQLAEKALHQKDYEKALQYSKNPEILGASEYELGNYQQAEKHFSETPESDVSLYNKGNSLAKSLRFAEAIEAYDKALSVNPDNQNARFNRDLIEKIIKENEAQKQQQTSPSNEEHKSQDEQQNSAKEDNNAANSQADADNSDNSAQQNTNDSAAHKPDKSSTQNKPTANNSTEKNHSESESSSSESGTKKPQSEQKKQKDAAENTDSEDARRHPENNAQAGKKEAASSSQKDMPEKAAEETRYQDSSTVENSHDGNPDTGNKSLIQDGLTEEQRQQVNQWLRQVPDDPSGLLKNKFDYYYRLNQQQGKVSEQDERW